MRIQIAALAAVVSVALLVPFSAQGSTHVQYGVQDDAWLLYGPEAPAKRIEILQRLGVDMVRLTLRWDAVAPSSPTDARNPNDPAYHWDLYDPILERLHAAHIGVLISLWGTPPWANEGQNPNFMPNDATSLASFAYAASTKYPWITRWTVWNEPNVRLFLIPNSPSLYVSRLLNPTYRALKSANPRNLVAGGVTSPRKTPSGVSPIAWIRGMGASRALLDAYAQNPYPVRPHETPTSGGCWRCTEITMATLPKLITEVKRRFGTQTRIWLTEYGYNSKPPSKWLGVSNALPARYVSEAALRVYLASHVDLLIQFLVRDEPDARKWTSGFLTSRGKVKPSFSAFALPFAEVSRQGVRTNVWGQVRPRSGRQPYRLQQFRGGHWQWIGGTRLTTNGGFLRRVVSVGHGSRLRIWSPRDRLYSAILTVT
jgi:polysaccharide biosynthesis protein PslG